ncbi:MAG: IS21 family transposase [Planctomycetes bacterium]|nr:IS21 family transposase [Planctomycetota bacterium]
MTVEELRNRIVERWQAGASARVIGRELGVSRSTVRSVLAEFQAGRNGDESSRSFARPSKLDAWLPTISSLLARYPDITAARVYQELRSQGFTGRYTIVRERLRQLRPTAPQPVVRFETGPGVQAQMDYSTYTLDFTVEGRRREHLFGYMLGYSRRQYLRFVEHQDFETTVREHIRAFEHLGGVAATCLYDNMKVVVSGFDGHEPIYNPRFLAFATHYGHLNDVTRWWLEQVSNVHLHRTTNQRPIDRHAEELPYLIPLPARAFDPSPVVYRVVDAEGLVAWRGNRYSVPWRYIGQTLPVRITETEVIIYSPQVEELARHPLLDAGTSGQQSVQSEHQPRRDGAERLEMLRERFAQLGEVATRFLDGLLTSRRNGKDEAQKILALLGTYAQLDLLRALTRAVRYGAFSLRAVERILAVTARPKGLLQTLADEARQRLAQLHPDPPVPPRPTSDYQSLLEEPADGQGPPVEDQPHEDQLGENGPGGEAPA